MAGRFLEDDLASILNTDDFAVIGVLLPVDESLTGRDIKGIFDDEDVEIEGNRDNHTYMVKSARFQVRTCEDIREDDKMLIEGTKYRVAVLQDDGTGMTTLHLEKLRDD